MKKKRERQRRERMIKGRQDESVGEVIKTLQ